MKSPKRYLLLVFITCTFLSACSVWTSVTYLGETYPPNSDVEIYYSVRDVKHEHKVIGHLSTAIVLGEEHAKKDLLKKAQTVGADGVIFTGFGITPGKDGNTTITADAIKFTLHEK